MNIQSDEKSLITLLKNQALAQQDIINSYQKQLDDIRLFSAVEREALEKQLDTLKSQIESKPKVKFISVLYILLN